MNEKKFHDIRRDITKKREEISARNKGDQNLPPINTSLQTKEGEENRELEWQLLKALYQGADEIAIDIIDTEGITDTERELLAGLHAAWFESIKEAKKILNSVASKIVEKKKAWPFIGLAMVSIDTGKFEEAEKLIDRAKRFTFGIETLSILVELISVRIDIERGSYEDSVFASLNEILKTCNDNFLKASIYHYLGWVGRFIASASENREKYLLKALKLFNQEGLYLYQQALIQLELSYISSKDQGLEDSARFAKDAADLLKKVGRVRESRQALARYQDLLSEVTISYESEDDNSIGDCLFISTEMKRIRRRINRISFSDREPVLILGPRGSGKDMIANAIHQVSGRRNGPFLPVNCSAISEKLIESELFGHEKGSFTGADKQKKGLFELADGGTLFLDEIGDMPLGSQVKLLRVLQGKPFFRVGGETEIVTNVRVIAATNRNLDEMVSQKLFRDDLKDRLEVFKIVLPPLDTRKEEILPFAERFLEKYGDGQIFILDNSARQYLLTKNYPGNIRILENDIKRGIAAARENNTNTITAEMLCDDETLPSSEDERFKEIPHYDRAMFEFERDLLLAALKKANWNRNVTAEILGVSIRTVFRILARHKF